MLLNKDLNSIFLPTATPAPLTCSVSIAGVVAPALAVFVINFGWVLTKLYQLAIFGQTELTFDRTAIDGLFISF